MFWLISHLIAFVVIENHASNEFLLNEDNRLHLSVCKVKRLLPAFNTILLSFSIISAN